jgi:hypothetical protein
MSKILPESIEDLKLQLQTILQAIDEMTHIGITGSPLSAVLALASDIISLLSDVFLHMPKERTNPEPRFVEEIVIKSSKMIDLPEVFWSPVDEHYYIYKSDPLGNPLQLQVNFKSKLEFKQDDAEVLSDFFDWVAQTLSFLSIGRIHWRFIKSLHNMLSSIKSSNRSIKQTTLDKQKRKNRYGYFKRKQRNKRGSHSQTNPSIKN